jgi:hypothetical protein
VSVGAKVFAAVNLVMTGLFLFAAAVQYNDPEPLRWMAIYGVAAAACVVTYWHPQLWALPVMVGITALVWSIGLWRDLPSGLSFGDLFEPMSAYGGAVEQAREMLGLLIVAVWMAILLAASRRPFGRRPPR